MDSFIEAVVDIGKRPSLDSKWPQAIKYVLSRGFSSDHTERPTMEEVRSVLKREYLSRIAL